MLTKIRQFLTVQHVAMLIISVILLQTLPFKFLALPESVALFTKLGQEPRGRIGTGILELCGVIGLWAPRVRTYAALGICCLMMGALYFHATVLGWDGLAISAAVVLVCAVYVVVSDRI